MKTKKIATILMTLVIAMGIFTLIDSNTIVSAGDVMNSAATPANASTYYVSSNITLSVTITTKTGANMNQTFRTNVSGAWTTIEDNIKIANSTQTDYLSGMTTYGSKYFWSSNISNYNTSREWDNNTYYFYTRATAAPSEGGSGTSSSYRVGVYIKDSSGNSISGATILINSITRVTNPGGYVSFLLDDGTYSVRVTHDDYTFAQGSLVVNGADRTFTMSVIQSGTPALSITEDAGITDDVKIGIIVIAAAVLGYSMIFVKGYSPKKLLMLAIPAIVIIAMITL